MPNHIQNILYAPSHVLKAFKNDMERRENMYALDHVFFSGLVCCGSLWGEDDIDPEGFGKFMEYARERHKQRMEG